MAGEESVPFSCPLYRSLYYLPLFLSRYLFCLLLPLLSGETNCSVACLLANGPYGASEMNNDKRLIVALVLLFTIALFFKVHWIVGYVLLITGLLFLILYLPSPKWRRLLITLYLFFFITLLTSTGLQMFLATNRTVARLVEENGIVNFLIGGLVGQIILSTLIGLITGASAVGVLLLPPMLISSEYILALHEVHGIKRKDALRMLWSLIVGINYLWMIIEGGKVTQSKPEGVLSEIGGPGVAVIRAGNAVVFERSGKISQVAGSRLVLLKQYERIRAIFELRPLGETKETENVLTKDRIPLTIVMGVGFQIEPKEVTDQRPESFVEPNGEALSEVIGDDLYQTYGATLKKAVYHAPLSGWGVMTPGAAQSLLRDIIATYNFDEIFKRVGEEEGKPGGFDPDQRTIKEIENKIMERLSAAAPRWGAHVQGVDIREIRIREDVLGKVLDWWGVEWGKRIAIQEAKGERRPIERGFNPYICGDPIREPDMFFGREEALAEVLDTIHNNHVAIYGERRIGKTSLLHQLDHRLREMEDPQYLFIPAFVNLQGVPAERLFYTLMGAVARSCQPRIGPLNLIYAAKKEGYDAYDLVDDLETVLEALEATTDKRIRLVLLLDEGDELNKYDPRVQARLRGIFMTGAGQHLGMVWSGLSIDKEWKLGTSPWYNLFAIEIRLAPFTREEALRLIQEPVKGIYRYNKDAIELILQYSEHRPFRIQQICLATINRVLAQKRRRVTGLIRVTKEDVERAYQGLAAEEAISREMEERGRVGLLEKQVAEGQAGYQVDVDGQGDQ